MMGYAMKVEKAIALLREYEPEDGYYGCFSGGKDSVVIKALADMGGIKADWHYNATGIDPPELTRFIRQHHPDVEFVRPKRSFFESFPKRGFPTRKQRWCCAALKEHSYPRDGRSMLMGIRAEESGRRARDWDEVSAHWKSGGLVLNPIFHWTQVGVWEFIRDNSAPYCSLYDEGFDRLGCIGCPQARKAGRDAQFVRWPGHKRAWASAFRRLWSSRPDDWSMKMRFDSWEEMWEWWLSNRSLPKRRDK